MRSRCGGMSCLSKTLSQTRDSPAPGSQQQRVRASAGGRPPEYCAGYCPPAPRFWQRCNFSLPQAGVRILTRRQASPHTHIHLNSPCKSSTTSVLGRRIQQQDDSCGILRSTLFSFKRKCRRSVGIVKLSGTNDCYLAHL